MHGLKSIGFSAALLAGCLAAACGGVIDPSRNQVETFSGADIAPGGGGYHELTSGNGEFSVRITALSPVNNVFMGVRWGQVSQGTCVQLQSNFFARIDLTALAGAVNSGRHCVEIFDVGAMTQPWSYTLSVSHP
jgi:hypothetical protein